MSQTKHKTLKQGSSNYVPRVGYSPPVFTELPTGDWTGNQAAADDFLPLNLRTGLRSPQAPARTGLEAAPRPQPAPLHGAPLGYKLRHHRCCQRDVSKEGGFI